MDHKRESLIKLAIAFMTLSLLLLGVLNVLAYAFELSKPANVSIDATSRAPAKRTLISAFPLTKLQST